MGGFQAIGRLLEGELQGFISHQALEALYMQLVLVHNDPALPQQRGQSWTGN